MRSTLLIVVCLRLLLLFLLNETTLVTLVSKVSFVAVVVCYVTVIVLVHVVAVLCPFFLYDFFPEILSSPDLPILQSLIAAISNTLLTSVRLHAPLPLLD